MIRYEWLDKPIEVTGDGVPLLASQSIGMNVLSLDEQHVVVQDIQVQLTKDLGKHGFTPIPVRWRHGPSLGGGSAPPVLSSDIATSTSTIRAARQAREFRRDG